MTASSELVSILIPTYNREGVIEKTIRSALDQTYTDIEVVVVDNASTDETWTRIQAMANADPRVRAFRNDRNLGPVANWLACAQVAKGHYAKILWSDDLIAPSFVSRCVPYLRNEDVAFAYTPALIFSGDSPKDGGVECYRASRKADELIASDAYIEGVMTDGDFPASPGCAIFRTEDLRRNLRLQVPNRYGSDFSMHAMGNDLVLFLLTALERRQVAIISDTLSFFRSHEDSISLLAGAGRVTFHYDLAKAWFCAEVTKDRPMQRRLNALIFLHLKRFGPAPYGMSCVADFYPAPQDAPIAWWQLVRAVGSVFANKVSRTLRRA